MVQPRRSVYIHQAAFLRHTLFFTTFFTTHVHFDQDLPRFLASGRFCPARPCRFLLFSAASSALKIARMRRKFNFSTHFPGLFPFWTASLCQQHIILSIPQKFSPDYTQFFHIITVK